MKGDFTRDTFRPERRYSSVRMQQGRVQLDADWNEAEDIRLARERTEVRDIVGLCGAPIDNAGFEVTFKDKDKDFLFGPGRLYVQGVLAQNDAQVAFLAQPDYPIGKLPDPIKPDGSGTAPSGIGTAYLFYLDVWEEHVTALEDSLLREVALNGPDTATRLRVVWQVKAISLPRETRTCAAAMALLPGPADARLVAKAKSLDDTEACTVKPGSSYKRLENQLYRVEVHEGGDLENATFKWSRDNGSVVSGFTLVDARTLAMDQIGRDAVLSFQAGGWIEVTDRKRELLAQPGVFFRVAKVEGNRLLLDPAKTGIVAADFGDGMKARRWDSQGAIHYDGLNPEGFLLLEDGVEIALTGTDFRSGDYWTIPARTVTGDVEWPFATPQPPRGIVHRRCPLAIASAVSPTAGAGNAGWDIVDCRNPFVPLADVIGMFYGGGDGQTAVRSPAGALGLAQAPTVGVARGKRPVKGAKVRWTVVKGGGSISGPATKETGPDGLVSCPWNLGSTEEVQQIRAELLDSEGGPTHIPIVFTAFLPKPTGGAAGCCRSIGQDGDYPTIEAAIKDLVFEQGHPGICLCLMAGTHEWPVIEGEPPKPLRSVTLTGLRDASILVAKGTFKISEIPHLSLSDLTLQTSGGISLFGIQEIDFEHVDFEIKEIFKIEKSDVVRFRDCKIDSDVRLTFEDAQTLSMTGTEANISAGGHAIAVMGGLHLEVRGCVLNGHDVNGDSATLSISGVRTAQIVGNEISARRKAKGTNDPTRPPTVGGGVVGGVIGRIGDTLTAAGLKAEARKLIGRTAVERATNAEAVSTLVAKEGTFFGRAGAALMTTVGNVLRDPQADEARVVAALGAVNLAALDPKASTGTLAVGETLGVALQLEDGRGLCHVCDNLLIGFVALYGDPGDVRYDGERAAAVTRRILQSQGEWGFGSLCFSKNYTAAIRLAATFVNGPAFDQLLKDGTVDTPVFRSAAFSDNVFGVNPVETLFSRGTFTANQFNGTGGDYGVAIGTLATYTGNLSDNDARLFSATRAKAVAGNLRINIV